MIRKWMSLLLPVTALDKQGTAKTVSQNSAQSADCCCYEPPGGCW